MSVQGLKKALKDKKVIIGTERTIKNLKSGKVEEVFLASNCPKEVVDLIEHYTKILGTKVSKINLPNDEIGAICKKPFSVNVLCY